MEGLQRRLNRSSSSTKNPEDEAEFLDEQEQDQLVQDLKAQNERSNLAIQRGMILIGILVSAIYAIFLYDAIFPSSFLSVPRIPIPFNPAPVTLPSPVLAASTSILSLYSAIFAFARAVRLSAPEIICFGPTPSPDRGLGTMSARVAGLSAMAALVAPLIALWDGSIPALEFIFWLVPLLVLGMKALAIHMMLQVDSKIIELEKAKYKYKGA
ncbi:hypothetical protein BX666DRAFT_1949181 [Dichotomocladium elegans]|nr:hypothetical protein BX666DRAFT_1949181 [Dichotomocladium elegans]